MKKTKKTDIKETKATKIKASNVKEKKKVPAKKKPKKRPTKADKAIAKIGNDANRSLSKYLQEISKYEPLSPDKEVD